MNKFKLHKAGINIGEGMLRLELDKETFETIMLTFIDDNTFNLLCQAIAEKNISSAYMHAHSLKGMASNLSMTKLYSLIQPVVEILKKDTFEHVEELMPQVKEAYNLVMEVLQSESQKT